MREVVFLLEEVSAQAMLEGILPRLWLEGITVRYIIFEGKQDLEKQLIRKLRAYQNAEAQFVVLRDQDAHPDCKVVKERLEQLCISAGKPDALVRIACREIESFYLADLSAVERGLEVVGLARLQAKEKYRMPDRLSSPSGELRLLTNGIYQKVSSSRSIAPWLDLENRRSPSFRNLIAGLRRIIGIADC